MNPLFKRELLLWGTCAVLIGGYIALGQFLAPEIPPKPAEPSMSSGVRTQNDLKEYLTKRAEFRKLHDARNEAIRQHNAFLRRWYQWGAGVGIVLVLLYTWWRPPWRIPPERQPTKRERKKVPVRAQLPMSPKALFTLIATILLVIGFAVFLAIKVF